MGRIIDSEFKICQQWQRSKPLTTKAANRARTRADLSVKETKIVVREMEIDLTKVDHLNLDQEHVVYVDTINMGGGLAEPGINTISESADAKCDKCGADQCTPDHTLWYWPYLEAIGDNIAQGIAWVCRSDVPACIKRGIDPAMTCKTVASLGPRHGQER